MHNVKGRTGPKPRLRRRGTAQGRAAGLVGAAALAAALAAPAYAQTITVTGDVVPSGPVTLPGWTAFDLTVGNTGTGLVQILGGATITTPTTGILGFQAGSQGSMIVRNDGSQWTVGALIAGSSGTGFLTVGDSGKVVSGYGIVGGANYGEATVAGAGSLWQNAAELIVGSNAGGMLWIVDGGKVESGIGVLGVTGSGSAFVFGTGSEWSAGDELLAGVQGTGALWIADGGKVAASTVTLGASGSGGGTITLEGTDAARGVLETGQVSRGAGAGSLAFDGGILRLTGDQNSLFQDLAPGDVAVAGEGAFIDTNGFEVATGYGLAGAGGLTKQGEGALTLAGLNAYTGATAVTGGLLVVNGSIASSSGLNVAAGAAVGGVGILPATIVSGTLAPGNSIGTMTVSGSLVFAPGSTYTVEVSPADADRTNVVAGSGGPGSADLSGATVVAVYAPGSYVAKEYVIVQAEGGLGGTRFVGLEGEAPAGFAHTLAYDATSAWLVLRLLMGDWSGLDANQQGVADALNAYFERTGGLPAAFAELTPQGLTANSGESGTSVQQAGLLAADRFLDAISGPLLEGADDEAEGSAAVAAAYAPALPPPASPATGRFGRLSYGAEELAAAAGRGPDAAARALRLQHRLEAGYGPPPRPERFSVWGAALAGGVTLGGDPAIGSQAAAATTAGLASGFDRVFRSGAGTTRAGFALGASWSDAAVAGLGTARMGSVSAGLRASHDFGRLYLAGAAAYGAHFATTTRSFAGETYSAAFTAQSFSGRVEAGWRLSTKAVDLLPFAAARALAFAAPAYAETGSGAGTFALAYQPSTGLEARSEIGIRLRKGFASPAGGATTLSGMAGWAHHFSRGRSATAGFAALPGTQFTAQGATGAADTGLVSLGIDHRFANGLAMSFHADGELGSATAAYAAKAKIRWAW